MPFLRGSLWCVHCSDRFSPSWEGCGTGGAVCGEVLSKLGGRGWSAPCRRLSKDARDPPHPGLGVFGTRGSTHLLFPGHLADYISQQARRRLPALESWRRPSQSSPPASLWVLPCGVAPLATQRVAFLELGTNNFSSLHPRVSCKRHVGATISRPGSHLFPEQGGDSEHSPPPSPIDEARLETRKHMGVIRGGTSTSMALFSFPPSILFLESCYSISSSPSSPLSNSSSTHFIIRASFYHSRCSSWF